MNAREIKRQIGALRDKALYGIRDQRLKVASEAARVGWIAEAVQELRPLPEPKNVTAEVHTLCGEDQANMGIWASWSVMRYLSDARFVVHSDGTLSQRTIDLWQRLVPGTRVFSRDAGLAALETRLANFPHVLNWTRDYHFGAKLGGIHALAKAPQILDMDTDVLVLSDPRVLRECLETPDWSMAWNREKKSHYAYPEALFRKHLGDRIGSFPEGLNGGFMLTRRLSDEDWALIDDVIAALEKDPHMDPLRYWMHQTLFAVLASSYGDGARALPKEYEIHYGATRPDSAVRHYVGNPGVRPRFFTEGIPVVIRDARSQGQLPLDFFRNEVPD